MSSGPPTLPKELRERIVAKLGELDAATEAVAVAVLGARNPVEFLDAERGVAQLMRERADTVVGAVLQYRAGSSAHVEPARERAHAAAKGQGAQLVSNGRRQTCIQLLGGLIVTLLTLRLRPVLPPRPGPKRRVGQRGANGTGYYPVLADLGITGRATPALMAEVAREVAGANSFEVARASLRERGLDIEHKTALRLTYEFAERALGARDAQLATLAPEGPWPEGELSGQRIVMSVDGGRIRIRENPIAGRRNKKTRHRRYKAPWREPKVMTVYVINDEGERNQKFKTILDGTMGDADDVVALLVGHLRLRGAHFASHVTLIGDGAEWIWGRSDEIRRAIGIPVERFTEVVDYFHAVEYLNGAAALRKDWSDGERAAWVKRVKQHLHNGRVEKVLEAITELRRGRRAKALATCIEYFRTHCERMRYDQFRDNGLPTGSGAVESAVRRVVNLRMKGNSMYWLPEHAEAMLHLRAHLKAGRWDELVHAAVNQPVWQPPG